MYQNPKSKKSITLETQKKCHTQDFMLNLRVLSIMQLRVSLSDSIFK